MLSDFFRPGRLGLSFELFPPKTDDGVGKLIEQVEQLTAFSPDFLTCTYGAGGSTRERTLTVLEAVRNRFDLPVASHLTVVGSTVDDLRGYLRRADELGVSYIVALRGDPPKDAENFQPVEDGLRYANELTELIRSEFPQFGIIVAGYPETHQEAPSPEADLENLKRKCDAGADVVVTQLFYDNDDYRRWVDRCESIGIETPIVPGIMPVTNLAQIKRIASMCGAKLPQAFVDRLGEKPDDKEWQEAVGIEFARDQVQELIDDGVAGLHFYVLNRSKATSAILRDLDLRAAEPATS